MFVVPIAHLNTPPHSITCLQIDWNQSAEALHNWIRGNDKVPGAWAEVDGQVVITDVIKVTQFGIFLTIRVVLIGYEVTLSELNSTQRALSPSFSLSLFLQKVTFYGSSLVDNGAAAKGQPLEIPGASRPAVVTKSGLVLFGTDGKSVSESKTLSRS